MVPVAHTAVSNAHPDPLEVWIEPWCDALELPARSTLRASASAPEGSSATPPIMEIIDGRLVLWASCPGTARIEIDGIVQNTASMDVSLPAEMFDLPIKTFVDLVFGNQPAARPGGLRPQVGSRWLQSLLRRLRFGARDGKAG